MNYDNKVEFVWKLLNNFLTNQNTFPKKKEQVVLLVTPTECCKQRACSFSCCSCTCDVFMFETKQLSLRFKVVSPDVILFVTKLSVNLNQCYVRYFTSQGWARRVSKPFSNFCPSHPKPKNFQSTQPSGEKRKRSLSNKLQSQESKCVQSD